VKLSAGDLCLHELFSSCEFNENQCSESHAAHINANEMMPVFSAFSSNLEQVQ
jgi:hypothetical protein